MTEEYISTKNKIYNYHPITGEYLFSKKASIDPLETKNRGYEVYTRPANSTFIEPPNVKENEIPVFINGKWIIKAQIIYKNKVVTTKSEVDFITYCSIKDLGEEKAKTEKLISGNKSCEIWNNFIEKRNELIQEGKDFIKKYDLK